MSLISWSTGQLVQASATVFLNFESGLEPGGEHLGPLAVELLIVWNQLPALFEPRCRPCNPPYIQWQGDVINELHSTLMEPPASLKWLSSSWRLAPTNVKVE